MLLMATSNGESCGASVLEIAEKYFPRFGAKIIATFSLPTFDKNFNEINGIVNEELKNKLISIIKKIQDEQI